MSSDIKQPDEYRDPIKEQLLNDELLKDKIKNELKREIDHRDQMNGKDEELSNDENAKDPNQKPTKKRFDVDLICKAFEEFNRQESLPLDQYIQGYKELSNFFDNLGKIFSFVASDVDSKLVILENYRQDKEVGKYYCDLHTMVDYERKENLFKTTKNGTRNLLRLHRALQFISEFLNEVTKLDEHENTNSLAILAYERTLMKYHSWIVSKAAKIAMWTLPVRSELVRRVFDSNSLMKMSREQINESMLRISKLTEQAFNSTQRLYEENDLLELA